MASEIANGGYTVWIRCIGDTLEVYRFDEFAGFTFLGRMTGLQTVNTSRVQVNTAGNMTGLFDNLQSLMHRATADSFADDFAGIAPSGSWTAAGSWSIETTTSDHFAKNTSASGNDSISRGVSAGALDNWCRYQETKNPAWGSRVSHSRDRN